MLQQIADRFYNRFGPKSSPHIPDGSRLEQLAQASEVHALSDYLPYVTEEEGIFLCKHSTGFVLESLPLLGSSEAMENQLGALFRHELPENSSIQFLLLASKRVLPHIEHWKTPRKQRGGILEEIANRRGDFFARMAKEAQPHVARNFRLLISVSFPSASWQPSVIESAQRLKQNITTSLKHAGFHPQNLDAQGLLTLLDEWINPTADLQVPALWYRPLDAISEQIPSSRADLTIEEGALQWSNGFKAKVFGILRYPSEWVLSGMDCFLGNFFQKEQQVGAPFFLHLGVYITQDKSLKGRMMAKCSNIERQAASPIAKWIPSIGQEAAEWALARKQLDRGERFVSCRFSACLLAPTASFDEQEHKLMSIFESQGWQVAPESYSVLPNFLGCLPLTWGEGPQSPFQRLAKKQTRLSSEPVNLLPVQGEWMGHQSPGMLLLGRRGQLFTFDPFENIAGNFNVAVVGKSGSGKSVFLQEMLVSNLGLGGRAFVLDVGRSFERLAKLMKGAFIEFRLKGGLCINPFSFVPKGQTDILAMLRPILSLMASPKEGTSDFEDSLLSQALIEVWEQKGNQATITDVASWLLGMDEEAAKTLSKKLFPYTEKGDLGAFFNGPANVDLNSSFVVIELEELKERKDLQAVVVQILILQITCQIYLGDRKTPCQLVLDEAWDLLRGKGSQEFIETAARRMRKYRGSLVTGTQSVNDYYASPGALAAFENSDWMILLEQKSASIEQLKKSGRLGEMSPYLEKTLKSVHTRKGEYAEALIYGPQGFVVGRLILDRFSQLLYTTDAREFVAIQTLQNQGLSLTDALARLADANA